MPWGHFAFLSRVGFGKLSQDSSEGYHMWVSRMRFLHIALAASTLALGCAGGRPASKPVQDDKATYRLESEGQVALDESAIRREVDRVDEFEEAPVAESALPVEDVEVIEPAVTAAPASSGSMPGYRVQIFASGSRTSAEAVRQAVASALDLSAYVEQVDGIYKVRVGDCPSRPEAEDVLQRCRRAGYSDAWIVSSSVVYKRPEG